MPKNNFTVDDNTRLIIVNHNYFIRSVITKIVSLGAMTMTIGLLICVLLVWRSAVISKAIEETASKATNKVDSSYLLAAFILCIAVSLSIIYIIKFYMVVSEIKKLHKKATDIEISITGESDSDK